MLRQLLAWLKLQQTGPAVSHTRLAVGDFVYVQNRGAGHAKLQERWRPGLQVVMTQPFAETQMYS